jgi:hypothetical protein
MTTAAIPATLTQAQNSTTAVANNQGELPRWLLKDLTARQ